MGSRNPKWHRDEIILALDLYFNLERRNIDSHNPKIIEVSEILNKLPIFDVRPNEEKFRNSNGVNLKLSNFLALDPEYKGKGMTGGSKLDKEVFNEFYKDKEKLHRIANEIRSVVNNKNLSDKIRSIENDENSELDRVSEGQVLYRLHKVRERDQKIVKEKKKIVLRDNGKLECEACEFDFSKKYGEHGFGFIECHHLISLSSSDIMRETRLEDLALVCSNCHRMFHKNLAIGSVNEFRRNVIQSLRTLFFILSKVSRI